MRAMPLVLSIDDDVNMLEIISGKLLQAGLQVETASRFAFGFKRAQDLEPDLILLDINMPDINGTEGILEFRSNEKTKDIPIIFFTSMSDPWPQAKDGKRLAEELGAAAILDKATDVDILAGKIKEVLGIKKE